MMNETEAIKSLQETVARHEQLLGSLEAHAEEQKQVNEKTHQMLQDVMRQITAISMQLGLTFNEHPEIDGSEKVKAKQNDLSINAHYMFDDLPTPKKYGVEDQTNRNSEKIDFPSDITGIIGSSKPVETTEIPIEDQNIKLQEQLPNEMGNLHVRSIQNHVNGSKCGNHHFELSFHIVRYLRLNSWMLCASYVPDNGYKLQLMGVAYKRLSVRNFMFLIVHIWEKFRGIHSWVFPHMKVLVKFNDPSKFRLLLMEKYMPQIIRIFEFIAVIFISQWFFFWRLHIDVYGDGDQILSAIINFVKADGLVKLAKHIETVVEDPQYINYLLAWNEVNAQSDTFIGKHLPAIVFRSSGGQALSGYCYYANLPKDFDNFGWIKYLIEMQNRLAPSKDGINHEASVTSDLVFDKLQPNRQLPLCFQSNTQLSRMYFGSFGGLEWIESVGYKLDVRTTSRISHVRMFSLKKCVRSMGTQIIPLLMSETIDDKYKLFHFLAPWELMINGVLEPEVLVQWEDLCNETTNWMTMEEFRKANFTWDLVDKVLFRDGSNVMHQNWRNHENIDPNFGGDRLLIQRDTLWLGLESNLTREQQRMKMQVDHKRRDNTLQVGSWMFLCLQSYCQRSLWFHKQHDIGPNYFRLYDILQRMSIGTYKPELHASPRLHRVVHAAMLKPCHDILLQLITPQPRLENSGSTSASNLEDKVLFQDEGIVMTQEQSMPTQHAHQSLPSQQMVRKNTRKKGHSKIDSFGGYISWLLKAIEDRRKG